MFFGFILSFEGIKNFKKLRIWENGFQIAIDCYKMIEVFPKEERYSLSSQIIRAAVSIPSDITEGSSRSSEKDQARFIEISLGSAFELHTQVLIAKSLNFGEPVLRSKLLENLEIEQRMLHTYLSRLKD